MSEKDTFSTKGSNKLSTELQKVLASRSRYTDAPLDSHLGDASEYLTEGFVDTNGHTSGLSGCYKTTQKAFAE
jgi:hypothetical protein